MCVCVSVKNVKNKTPDNAGLIKIKSVVVSPVVDFVERTSQQPHRIRQACQRCGRLALLDVSTHFCVSCRLKQHLAHQEQVKAYLKSLALPSVDNLDELAIATSQSTVLQELQGVLQSLTRHHERFISFSFKFICGFSRGYSKR